MASCEDDYLSIFQDRDTDTEAKQEMPDTCNPQSKVTTPKTISFDMWNGCTLGNFRTKLGQNKTFKPLCIYVLKEVTEFLSRMKIQYFVCGGTALAVYREGGKMICHDGDVDIAIFESDFSSVVQNISSLPAIHNGYISLSDKCPFNGTSWFDEDGSEISYNGCGGKRLKFFATRKLWVEFGVRGDLLFDSSLAHLDVFTFGQHPDDPTCFCYNWNICGKYDFRRKRFPKSCVLPLKTYKFEGVCVQGPSCLETFLEVEYGYLGRDAMFDSDSQLYVKIPESIYKQMRKKIQKVLFNAEGMNAA